MKKIGFYFLIFVVLSCHAQNKSDRILTGAEQGNKYLSVLANKKVGLVVNHTAMVDDIHLVDFLLKNKIDIRSIFAPEHGFRGDASAGETIKDGVDLETGI